jgi:hypothetical protein
MGAENIFAGTDAAEVNVVKSHPSTLPFPGRPAHTKSRAYDYNPLKGRVEPRVVWQPRLRSHRSSAWRS